MAAAPLPAISIHWCVIFNPLWPRAKGEGDALANAIHENDGAVPAKIRKRAKLGEFAPQVRVVEGYLISTSGKVEWSAK